MIESYRGVHPPDVPRADNYAVVTYCTVSTLAPSSNRSSGMLVIGRFFSRRQVPVTMTSVLPSERAAIGSTPRRGQAVAPKR